jgi:hypothetical protein
MLDRLHPDDLDALATAVAEKVMAALSPDTNRRLLTAAEVAARYGVRASWVRANSVRLGVIRIGDGERPRLRFDPALVTAELGETKPETEPTRVRRRKVNGVDLLELLPVPGFTRSVSEKGGPGSAGTLRGPTPVAKHQRDTEATRPRRSRTTAQPRQKEAG